jgi:hypothetical protein
VCLKVTYQPFAVVPGAFGDNDDRMGFSPLIGGKELK